MSLKVGIVSAMAREVGPLLKDWKRESIRNRSCTLAMWITDCATYVESGIGCQPAQQATKALVEHGQPDILISAGFAGALTRHLRVGDIITPGTVIDGHTDERFSIPGGTGMLVSVKSVANKHDKLRLGEQYGAEALDMESAAVARVAREVDIPFCAVKSISDEVDFPMPAFDAYITPNGKLALEKFAAHIAIRPLCWPNLVQLACNSKKAAEELSSTLKHLLFSITESGTSKGLQQVLQDRPAARPVN